jgi:hypothetical protein
MLCYVMLCYAMLCYIMLCYVLLCMYFYSYLVKKFVSILPLDNIAQHHVDVFKYGTEYHKIKEIFLPCKGIMRPVNGNNVLLLGNNI